MALQLLQHALPQALTVAGEDRVLQIRGALLEVVLLSSAVPMLLQRACKLLVAFAIRVIPSQWSSVVEQVAQQAMSSASQIGGFAVARHVALVFANTFAEDGEAPTLAAPQREAVRAEYFAGAPWVTRWTAEIFAEQPGTLEATLTALKCLEAWVKLPPKLMLPELQPPAIESHLTAALQLVVNEETREVRRKQPAVSWGTYENNQTNWLCALPLGRSGCVGCSSAFRHKRQAPYGNESAGACCNWTCGCIPQCRRRWRQ